MKLYEEIKKDIENINNNKNHNDLKSLLIRSVSLSRINYLLNRIDTYNKQNYSNNIPNKLSIDNLDELEDELNATEGVFTEEETNDIVSELGKIKSPELSFLDNQFAEEYTQFFLIDKTVKETIEIYYQNVNPSDNMNEIPKEIIMAFQKEAKALMDKEEYIGLVNKKTNIEYAFISKFIKNPAKNFVDRYEKIFKFDSLDDKELFISDVDTAVFNIDANVKAREVENDLLNQLGSKGKYGAEDIADDVVRIINSYYKTRNDFVEENPNYDDVFPSLGKFLYDVKEKLTEIVIDDDLELATDKPSKFIKEFLNDPVSGFKGYLDDANNLNDLFKNSLLENNEINGVEFTNIINEYKETILNEKENYDNSAMGKENAWKNHQEYKKEWFMNHFNTQFNNRSIEAILNDNKGGFFERLFNTTSDEYKEFSTALANMMKDGVYNGDLDGLKTLAQKYLSHKLDNYDPFLNGYDESEIELLDSTSKGRVNLCLSVIEAISEAKEAVENRLDPKRYTHKEVDYPEAYDKYWENKNNDFQNMLKNDSEIENDKMNEAQLDIDISDINNDIDIKKE